MTSGWQKYPSKSAGYTSSAQWQCPRRHVLRRDNHQCQIQEPHCTDTATASAWHNSRSGVGWVPLANEPEATVGIGPDCSCTATEISGKGVHDAAAS